MEITVQKIHNEIDSAQEVLLSNAISIIEKIKKESTIQRGIRLQTLGFVNTPDAIKSNQQINELDEYEKISNLIIEYSKDYPFLKFITIDKFDEICKKYKLIYAPVSNYIKDIPEKNIKELENIQPLKIHHYNNTIILKITNNYIDDNDLTFDQKHEIKKGIILHGVYNYSSDYFEAINEYFNRKIKFKYRSVSQFDISNIDNHGLFIAAPKSHFKLHGLKNKGLGFFHFKKIEPKDPIVFRYVKGGIQILSKWGDEANDSELAVPILN